MKTDFLQFWCCNDFVTINKKMSREKREKCWPGINRSDCYRAVDKLYTVKQKAQNVFLGDDQFSVPFVSLEQIPQQHCDSKEEEGEVHAMTPYRYKYYRYYTVL